MRVAVSVFVFLLFSPSLLNAQIGRQPSGTLESPASESVVSGIGVISGWICPHEGERVTIHINDGGPIPVAMSQPRDDTRLVCGTINNGFVTQVNWNLLPEGTYVAVAAIDGVEFGRSVFTVGTTGREFLTDLEFAVDVPDFPVAGEISRFVWNESTQHLELLTVAPEHIPYGGRLLRGHQVEGDPFVPRGEEEPEPEPEPGIGPDTPHPPEWTAFLGHWYFDSTHRPGRMEWTVDNIHGGNHGSGISGWTASGYQGLHDYTYGNRVDRSGLFIWQHHVITGRIANLHDPAPDLSGLDGYPYVATWPTGRGCFIYAFDYVDDTREEIAGEFWMHPEGTDADVWECWHLPALGLGDFVSGYKGNSAALAREIDRIVEVTRPPEEEPEEEPDVTEGEG